MKLGLNYICPEVLHYLLGAIKTKRHRLPQKILCEIHCLLIRILCLII